VQLHIGLDDTDSTSGGCTTYLAACIVEQLTKHNVRFVDYPNIIRLNPNIPYKTRGNAAVALRLETSESQYAFIRETVLNEIEQKSKIGEKGTEPAVVILRGKPPASVKALAERALCQVVPVKNAVNIVRKSSAEAAAYGNQLGLVGALAAVGNTIEGDHTYELIAYRKRENCGTTRKVDRASVIRMNLLTAPFTFSNYDEANDRVLVTPHGPDPVLVGIRGETPVIVQKGFKLVNICEPIERWMIFRTNHGTEAHFGASKPGLVKRFCVAVLSGTVAEKPRRIMGGHVILSLRYEQRKITCAAYEPTGKFRDIVSALIPGDKLTVFGGTPGRRWLTVNLEKIHIHSLTDHVSLRNPTCPKCHKNLKSAGYSKGFKCDRCSITIFQATKIPTYQDRKVRPGIYLPTAKANRHLTKPLYRYGHEKIWMRAPPSGKWHNP